LFTTGISGDVLAPIRLFCSVGAGSTSTNLLADGRWASRRLPDIVSRMTMVGGKVVSECQTRQAEATEVPDV
jgi:hypothetical protein